MTYQDLSERWTRHRCSLTSPTNRNSGRTACPMGWKASGGSRGCAWSRIGWPHAPRNSAGNPRRRTRTQKMSVRERRLMKSKFDNIEIQSLSCLVCLLLWHKRVYSKHKSDHVQADRRDGGLGQCAVQSLRWRRSGRAERAPSCLERSRWGWRRSETETKPTGCYAEAPYLQGEKRNWLVKNER